MEAYAERDIFVNHRTERMGAAITSARFIQCSSDYGASHGREQLLLHFYYLSAKICITRPSLCRLDRRAEGRSEGSAEFNRRTAAACVQAALDLALLLPEPPDPRWIYEIGPWWSSVHISEFQGCTKKDQLTFLVMQAITVLLLELAQGAIH